MGGMRTQAVSGPVCHFEQDGETGGRSEVAQVNGRALCIEYLECG